MTAAITPGSLESLLDTNKLAFLVYEAAFRKVADEAAANGYPVSAATADAWKQAASDLARTVDAVVLKAPYGSRIWTPDAPLIVSARLAYNGKYGVLWGDGEADAVVLTTDGWGANTAEWHVGKSTDSIYYERYTAEGRVAHGWVDIESRRLTQTG